MSRQILAVAAVSAAVAAAKSRLKFCADTLNGSTLPRAAAAASRGAAAPPPTPAAAPAAALQQQLASMI